MDNEDAAVSALESAFGNMAPAPKAAPVVAPEVASPGPVVAPDDAASDLEQAANALDAQAEPESVEPVGEPEFVIEVDGKQEVVRGQDQVRELLQKGVHYSRGSEEVARAREQLQAQAHMQQFAMQFQQQALVGIAELRAIDQQMEQFSKVDLAALMDTDFVAAMKLQQQRQSLKEARDAKVQELNQTKSQYEQDQAKAAQQLRAAEEGALLAKLPEWRNSERADVEKQAIIRALATYGYQNGEIAKLLDHRTVLMARDAMKWQELQRNKSDKVKQVREAPPVVKPGAAAAQQDPNSKAGFAKFTQEFRKQGRAGNHRAQEAALEKVLARTFK